MKIYSKYLDEKTINEVTLEFALDKLEGSGYWEKGTVKEMLLNNEVVFNPYCEYAISKKLL